MAANNRINDAERYAVQVSDTTKVEENFNRIGQEKQCVEKTEYKSMVDSP
jgi:hypothetical protein